MQNTPWWAALLLVMNVIALLIGLKLLQRRPAAAPSAAQADLPAAPAPVSAPGDPEIPDRQQLIAAVVASIAEYEGTDISALRVVSFHQRSTL